MRIDRCLELLIPACVIGGAACLALEARQTLAAVGHLPSASLSGIALLLVGATAGLMCFVLTRRASRAIAAEATTSIAAGGAARTVDVPDNALRPLVVAMNDCFTAAERSVSDAVSEVKELEIQLKVATGQRQQAQAIIYSINDAVLVTDSFDEVLLANEAASKALELDLSQIHRRPIDQVLNDATLVAAIRDVRQSGSKNERRVIEHRLRRHGRDQTFKLTLSAIQEANGEPGGVVAVLHDMTREREVARMKNEFVSSVSHELRTPLSSIKAYVEMLVDGEAQDEKTTRDFYEIILTEANRLGRLIDNILNISRIESGLVEIKRQPLSVMTLVKEAIDVIVPQAKLRNIRVEEHIEPSVGQVNADKDMLYQAVLNLLSNAVKYTPEGGTVTVRAGLDEAAGKVSVRVIDTGVGIPAKDVPFVFDKFFRVEANKNVAKGTGLGLSLVKNIIETVHKGRIFVESEQGRGSCFGFELDVC
ncbi:PAS domain-containing protein [bacterium]|nr:MAG: PAS domain-containing protein [bacterium]